MTFLEALSKNRPMRRTGFRYWIFLGASGTICPTPAWRSIYDGSVTGISKYDYQASDWEVMP